MGWICRTHHLELLKTCKNDKKRASIKRTARWIYDKNYNKLDLWQKKTTHWLYDKNNNTLNVWQKEHHIECMTKRTPHWMYDKKTTHWLYDKKNNTLNVWQKEHHIECMTKKQHIECMTKKQHIDCMTKNRISVPGRRDWGARFAVTFKRPVIAFAAK